MNSFSSVAAEITYQGYSVVPYALSSEEVQQATMLAWDHLETTYKGSDRNDVSTWSRLNIDDRGFVNNSHQCEAAWYVRSRPGVVSAFADIWNTRKLVTSMDTMIVWKPWPEREVSPPTEGQHLDQTHNELDTIQGMVVLKDVTELSGGLEVVPFSNTSWEDILTRTGDDWREQMWNGNWGPLPPDVYPQGSGKLLEANAGDLILWDSRTIHGGVKGRGGTDQNSLVRLAFTVCMVPRARLSTKTQMMRLRGFREGLPFNHHPAAPEITGSSPGAYSPIALSKDQRALL